MAAGRVDVQRRTNVGKFNRRRVHAFPRKTGYSNLPSNGNNSVAQNKNGYDLGSRRCGLENGVRVRNDGKPLNIDGDMECKSDFGGLMDIDDMGEEDAVAVAGESELDVEKTIDRGINLLLGCRNVFEYEKLDKISEGTYGIVYRARDTKTGEIMALKKLKILDQRYLEEFGFPLTSL